MSDTDPKPGYLGGPNWADSGGAGFVDGDKKMHLQAGLDVPGTLLLSFDGEQWGPEANFDRPSVTIGNVSLRDFASAVGLRHNQAQNFIG